MKSMKTLFFVFLAAIMLFTACGSAPTQTAPSTPEMQAQPSIVGIIGLVLIIGAAAYSYYLKRQK